MPADAPRELVGQVVTGHRHERPTTRRWRRAQLLPGEWLAVGWLGLVIVLALMAPVLEAVGLLPDPTTSFGEIARQGPAPGHPLGGDGNGRDVLSRLVFGARASMAVGVGSIAVSTLVGGFMGLVAGYYRGKIEAVLVWMLDVLLAFPRLVLALALLAVLASGEGTSGLRRITVLVIVLGLVTVPVIGRITRANTLVWAQRDFVLAARAIGTPDRRIILREVLPNVAPAMASIALLAVAVVIVVEGGLSLLGVGVQLPTPSWGNMIAEGRVSLRTAPHIVMAPTAAIFATVLALNYLGDTLRDRNDVQGLTP